MENHGNLSGKGEQVMAIIEGVDSPRFRATADTGNFTTVGEDAVKSVRMLLPWIAHVHFKDCTMGELGSFQGAIFGQGDVDIKTIVGLLKDFGYKGAVSFEYEGPEPEIENVVKSAEFTKDIYRSYGLSV